LRWGLPILIGIGLGLATYYEIETSWLQARLFSAYAARVSYEVADGASDRIAFPTGGPFDWHRGYTSIPNFTQRLAARGYRIARQATVSTELQQLVVLGVTPPYPETGDAGLLIRNPDGTNLFDATARHGWFQRFEDIPPIVVAALLFIENRELLTTSDPRRNPVIEWNRMARAGAMFAASKLGFGADMPGGSTLAIQIEKYRHSPAGRTHSAQDKLRQIIAASLKAYQDGPDTRARREQIVVDYLNTMPLAATAGTGEVYGLGEGLNAWFGLDSKAVMEALVAPEPSPAKAAALKHVLALITAVQAPTYFLVGARGALERRMDQYTDLMVREGVMDATLGTALRTTSLNFLTQTPLQASTSFLEQKSLNAVRTELLGMLGVERQYDLGRLHLSVDTTIDPRLQREVSDVLRSMSDPDFVAAQGLKGERLLARGDPRQVRYSYLLYERTALGNLERVHADNLDGPFDINDGTKMELGSTAKLRTMAHYLEVIADLQRDLAPLSRAELMERTRSAGDVLTAWVATTMLRSPRLPLADLLDAALERTYSTSPGEAFFTGGGLHRFSNFNRHETRERRTLRDALEQSTNLVFIRLMRDLVRYHQARLPYDATAVLKDVHHPIRRQLLAEIADAEGRAVLSRSHRRYRNLTPDQIIERLLGSRARAPRPLAVLFFAWKQGSTPEELAAWVSQRSGPLSPAEAARLYKAYSNPRLVLSDYGYLLSRNPLDLWCAEQLMREPHVSLAELVARSDEQRSTTASWLFRPRNRRAQEVRLRTRIEQDAFARMTPYWRRLGFPFQRLVPSLATSIGSSADRPAALADLMGILLNDGVRRPLRRVTRLDFAAGTPYETSLSTDPLAAERVMEPEVAAALRSALAGVVERGTAKRLHEVFQTGAGDAVVAGGKTGSGDNRFQTYGRGGGILASRAINRTATFAFYIGDQYFGVLTAHVPGGIAADYDFTSALPVSVLRLTAPILNPTLLPEPRRIALCEHSCDGSAR